MPYNLRDHVTMATPHFETNFSGILLGLSLGEHVPNLNHVPLATLELWPFHPPNLRDHVTTVTALLRNFFQGSCRDFPWEHACHIRSLYLQPFWNY